MSDFKFMAYQVAEAKQPATLVTLSEKDLPGEGLLVKVAHSSLNYKDGLAVLGRPGVVRSYPLTCGIDLAGEVIEATGSFVPGQQVVLTGAGLSETVPGGFSGYQRVNPESVVQIPSSLGTWGAMAVGTAGLTAMLCVLRLEATGITPEQGPVLVTGATGGVGSFAVMILARLGYEVHAVTGKKSEHAYLKHLGASEILDRSNLTGDPRALGKERWVAAIDSVGSKTLANVLSQISYGGSVAACGLAGGHDLPSTVMPFILRNVSLLGVDSVHAPLALRAQAWTRISELFSLDDLRQVVVENSFAQVPSLCEDILDGRIRGRVVIDMSSASSN